MTGLLPQLLAESEPFWQHPVVLVILVIVLVSLVLSVVAGVLKLLGVSLFVVLFFPFVSRVGRYLTVGLAIGIGASVLLRGELARFIKPTLSADEAHAKIRKILDEAEQPKDDPSLSIAANPRADASDLASRLEAHVSKLESVARTSAWQQVGDETTAAGRSLKKVIDRAAELDQARSAIAMRLGGLYALTKRDATAESVEELCIEAGEALKLWRKELTILKELESELRERLAELKAARVEMDKVPGSAGLLAEPIMLIERFAEAAQQDQDRARRVVRFLRRIRKVTVRYNVVDTAEKGASP